MITNQHDELISYLEQATIEGMLEWKETEVLNEYATKVGDYTITVFKLLEDGAYQIILSDTICAEMTFVDSNGDRFDRIVVNKVTGPEYQRLSHLHDIAKRSASGADKKLAEIISILKK